MTPHRITTEELAQWGQENWQLYASASTVDGTQNKRLHVRSDGGEYKVTRRYYADVGATQTISKTDRDASGWETIYCGPDRDEAVRFYNRLS